MAEYIEREALLRDIERYNVSDGAFQHWVEIQPAADVAPVRHGQWIDSLARITPYCSACGHSHRCLIRTPNYCPNCGAKMDDYTNSTKIYDE